MNLNFKNLYKKIYKEDVKRLHVLKQTKLPRIIKPDFNSEWYIKRLIKQHKELLAYNVGRKEIFNLWCAVAKREYKAGRYDNFNLALDIISSFLYNRFRRLRIRFKLTKVPSLPSAASALGSKLFKEFMYENLSSEEAKRKIMKRLVLKYKKSKQDNFLLFVNRCLDWVVFYYWRKFFKRKLNISLKRRYGHISLNKHICLTNYWKALDSKKNAAKQTLNKLPEKQKLVLKWYFFHFYSAKKIAKKLNITESSVRSHKQAGLYNIQKIDKELFQVFKIAQEFSYRKNSKRLTKRIKRLLNEKALKASYKKYEKKKVDKNFKESWESDYVVDLSWREEEEEEKDLVQILNGDFLEEEDIENRFI